MTSRPARVARGFATAATATLVAALFHTSAGGHLPHPLLLLTIVVAAGAFCTALAGRRISLIRLSVSVGVSQAMLHLLLSTGHPATTLSGTVHHGTAHVDAVEPAVIARAEHLSSELSMLAAHVIAAIATILALRFGEDAIWGLLDTARAALVALLRSGAPAPVNVPGAPRGRSIRSDLAPRRRAEFLSSVQHRGPPVGIAT